MKKDDWKELIKTNCEQAGTYQPHYDAIIDTLADIMDKRDSANEVYIASGGNPVVNHTNKGGATNVVKNPALVVLMELNTQALAYWRDLGLTPSGLKKLNAEVIKDKNDSNLDRILAKLL